MAKNHEGRQKEAPKNRKKAMREGYLSFDVEEVKRLSGSDSPNAEAYGYLYQAVTLQADTVKGIDDAYPETAAETAAMRELVDKAKSVLVDKSDTYFQFCVTDLEMILDWSAKRHWNFQWQVILGVILTVLFLSWRVDKKQENVEDRQALVDAVENWAESDTVLVWEDTPDDAYNVTAFVKYGHLSAINYKLFSLLEKKSSYASSMKYSDDYAAKADTARSRIPARDSQNCLKNLLTMRKNTGKSSTRSTRWTSRISGRWPWTGTVHGWKVTRPTDGQ